MISTDSVTLYDNIYLFFFIEIVIGRKKYDITLQEDVKNKHNCSSEMDFPSSLTLVRL